MFSLFSNEKELFKLFVSVVSNTLFPSLDFLFFELSQVLADRVVKLLDIFILFSVVDGL